MGPFEAIDRVAKIFIACQTVERHDDFQMAKWFLSFDMDEADFIRARAGDAAVFDAWADFAADDVLRMKLAEGQNHEKRAEQTDESIRHHGFPLGWSNGLVDDYTLYNKPICPTGKRLCKA